MAASLVDESVQALTASAREQQSSLLADWHGENTGTEELRAAVQHYHAFGSPSRRFHP
jgi:type VI protein secretion system component VasF